MHRTGTSTITITITITITSTIEYEHEHVLVCHCDDYDGFDLLCDGYGFYAMIMTASMARFQPLRLLQG